MAEPFRETPPPPPPSIVHCLGFVAMVRVNLGKCCEGVQQASARVEETAIEGSDRRKVVLHVQSMLW